MKRCPLATVAAITLIACAAVAADEKIPELDPQLCRQMATYQPEEGQSADYKPGVDVQGKPVVEADLTPNTIAVPDTVSFNVTVDLAQYLGLSSPTGLQAEAPIGKIEVDKTGHVTFNGQPLEGEAEKTLRALCAPKPEEIKN